MGAEPWNYFTPYQADVEPALQELRQREFEAGRYSGDSFPKWGEGARHDSIEDAMEDADADGTASILDIESVSLDPDDGLEPPLTGVAYPLTSEKLIALFGTDRPTRKMIEENDNYYDDIGRGECIYMIVYNDDKPSELFFAGYSYD